MTLCDLIDYVRLGETGILHFWLEISYDVYKTYRHHDTEMPGAENARCRNDRCGMPGAETSDAETWRSYYY